jgi:hypothetical protein
MTDPAADTFAIPLSIPSEHGLLHGRLTLVAAAAGLVILVEDCAGQDARNEVLAGRFRQAGLSTLSIDLLARQEAHFADVHNNVPLLAKRLLDFLELIRKRMLIGELAAQPLGLWAADATSPAAVRVAALRDHDIAALVCRGGLIDLAGMLYLRTLAAPLLVLIEETEVQLVASNRRALQEVHGLRELKLIPEIGIEYAASAGFEIAAGEASDWFVKHFAATSSALSGKS